MKLNRANIIGYELNKIIESMGKDIQYIIKITKTPLKSKIEERIGKEPIIINYKEEGNKIVLTASYFK